MQENEAGLIINEEKQNKYAEFTLQELEEKYKQLYWQSWKCFGLKIVTPLFIFSVFFGAILSCYEFEPEKDAYTSALFLGGSGGVILASSLLFSKNQHEKQKNIAKNREEIKDEINHRQLRV